MTLFDHDVHTCWSMRSLEWRIINMINIWPLHGNLLANNPEDTLFLQTLLDCLEGQSAEDWAGTCTAP